MTDAPPRGIVSQWVCAISRSAAGAAGADKRRADTGNTARRTIDASARCSDIRGAVYTVEVAGTEYELAPDHSRIARASSYLPLSATVLKQSSLANHLPGTAVKLRRDDDGFLVAVGKRESRYRTFVAH